MESKGGTGGGQEGDGIVIVAVPIPKQPQNATLQSSSSAEHHHHHHNNNNNNIKKHTRRRINPHLPPYKLNPRWQGYGCIALFSMICLGSIRHAKSIFSDGNNDIMNNSFDGNPRAGIAFGSLSLAITCFVLLHEYIQDCISQCENQRRVDSGFHDAQVFDFKVLWGGKVEGSVLVVLVLLWSIGLAYLTQVNGLAYAAGSMNAYWSAWLCFATCIYIFFDWITTTTTTKAPGEVCMHRCIYYTRALVIYTGHNDSDDTLLLVV
jgi:hypothetical protein